MAQNDESMTVTEPEQEDADKLYLDGLVEYLKGRIQIIPNFVINKESGLLTHQVIELVCGDYVSVSEPKPLPFSLLPVAPQTETKVTLH